MIRVLQVFGCMDRGGAESMIMELYRHIDRTKIQFDFVVHTSRKCAYDEEILSLGGRIFSVPSFRLSNYYSYKRSWIELISSHPEWNIVHGHVRSTASIYLSIAKKLSRYTIAHSHNTSSGKGLRSIIKNIFQKRIKHIADYFMACSEEAGVWLFGKAITESENYCVLKNAIDTSVFRYDSNEREKIRCKFGFGSKIVVGHIGSYLSEQKNQSFLLDIFKSINEYETNSVLLLIGDGPLRKSIETKAKELGISNSVIFTGVQTNVNELIQAMDVFLFPSLFEGLPVTLIEVQSTGLPSVISDRVPRETIITNNLVTVKSLGDSADVWARHVLSRIGEPRFSRTSEIIENGYDINTTSKWIEGFYLEKNQV